MNLGIIGAGSIAATMACTIRPLEEVTGYGIASRDIRKSQAFADKWGFQRAYGSYEEMLGDSNIDLVYVALPHTHHREWTIRALEAGRNVLCEKPFAVNSTEAKEMTAMAEEKKLLLAEAIWPRYLPARRLIDEVIQNGDIGAVKTVASNMCDRNFMNDRLTNPALAGGALLDLSVYTLNFSSMILGNDIRRITAAMVPTDTGVDGQDSIMLEYANGAMASMFSSIYTLTDCGAVICGEEGFIQIERFFNPKKITVFAAKQGQITFKKEVEIPRQITGYEYEVLACKRALDEGRIECPQMPHSETLEIMRQMDEIRRQFGIVYPFEKKQG